MTTAHRPTFEPARGGQGMRERDLSAQSKQYSSRDLPSHTRLKYRQDGQGTADEARTRDFKRDLEDRERRHRRGGGGGDAEESATAAAVTGASSKRPRLTDGAPAASAGSQLATSSSATSAAPPPANLDADDQAVAAADLDSDADDSADEEEDDTAELMAELQKIRRERAAEAAKRDAERQAEEERIRTENILKGNPLLNRGRGGVGVGAAPAAAAEGAATAAVAAEFKVKRRWNDDVVFKNCARDEDAQARQRASFVNDTLRSEFHKKFMDKYIK